MTIPNQTDPKPMAELLAEGQCYEVDDRGLFCRHCGRTSWLHYRTTDGLFCERGDHQRTERGEG